MQSPTPEDTRPLSPASLLQRVPARKKLRSQHREDLKLKYNKFNQAKPSKPTDNQKHFMDDYVNKISKTSNKYGDNTDAIKNVLSNCCHLMKGYQPKDAKGKQQLKKSLQIGTEFDATDKNGFESSERKHDASGKNSPELPKEKSFVAHRLEPQIQNQEEDLDLEKIAIKRRMLDQKLKLYEDATMKPNFSSNSNLNDDSGLKTKISTKKDGTTADDSHIRQNDASKDTSLNQQNPKAMQALSFTNGDTNHPDTSPNYTTNKSHTKNSRSFNSPSPVDPDPKAQPFKLSPRQVKAIKEEFNKSNEKYLMKAINTQKNANDNIPITNKSPITYPSGIIGGLP